MTTARPEPFRPALVKAVFRDVTPLHVSRSAAWAAASVTRTVLTEIVDGARRAAAEQSRKKLIPGDLISATDRDVELQVGGPWYEHSPTFRCRMGDLYDADGVLVPLRQRRGPRTPSAVAGAHRFEAGVRRLLRSRGTTAAPRVVRDLDGIASVFLTDLARGAAVVVRDGGLKRFGTVVLGTPDEAAALPFPKDLLGALSTRTGDRRTIDGDDVLAATTMVLFGGLRRRALTEARTLTAARAHA
jgi:histone H3/H4